MIFTEDSIDLRSKNIIVDFLDKSNKNFLIFKNFLRYVQTVLKLQRKWQKYQEKKKNRMKFLIFKWDYELENMIEYWKESKLRKHKMLLRKLQKIDPNIKKAMLDLYYRKTQHLYAAKFYEWRKHQLAKSGVSKPS